MFRQGEAMLIVTRRIGEVIVIGENEIRITVLGVNGSQARLGIHAPSNIKVLREELYLRDRAAA